MPWLVGYPREKVDWSPTIDPVKCVSCGICMNCGKGVYAWTAQGPVVARPTSCVIGCTTCANLCLGKAISFPDIETVRSLYRREGIWGKVKADLIAQGIIELT